MSHHFTRIGKWQAALALGLALALTGCSTPHIPKPAPGSSSGLAWSGRMGLQVQDPLEQEQSFSASFHLQGSPEQGSLDVFNPLGSQIAKLQWQPGSALLQQGERITQSDSLQELLRQSLGTALPVQALFSWLQGHNASAEGWQVDLSRHSEGRITAQRITPLPHATLRVVLQPAD